MAQPKTLRQREAELQALLATPRGRVELDELVSRYAAASGRVRPEGTSVLTYLLVHERERGLIVKSPVGPSRECRTPAASAMTWNEATAPSFRLARESRA